MCVEIFKENIVYDMIKCLFHFYAIESYINGISFDITFRKFQLIFDQE